MVFAVADVRVLFDDVARFPALFDALFADELMEGLDARFAEAFALDALVAEVFLEAWEPRFAVAFAFEEFFALVVAIRGALAKSVPDDSRAPPVTRGERRKYCR